MEGLSIIFKNSHSHAPEIAPFSKVSYSQSGEDLIVDFIFKELGIQTPTYIDIGAHHPYYLSNTAIFYSKGSRGINIEPDPSLFLAFEKERNFDINLNVGIADKESTLDFYVMNVNTLNTFLEKEVENYCNQGDFHIKEVKKINVTTLRNVLEKYNKGVFPDFLTLDAEGVDEIVLKSIDFEKNKPTVICTETISFSSNGKGIKNVEIIHYLESKGYLLYADTNINSIFVVQEKWVRD
jgi:FkbM family methyltransferase